eukprot:TRINITY_DN3868_c0_g1_i1.p1 TRINITY_DN3868_c0_g1~~TRINITY_DN3868_c0_g1_i1.p1  ORF type:complete len:507 (+),score=108.39 TRINITY_DN3868_c0_g1_i1:44-1564(+)
MTSSPTRIAIVGGGIAGLTCAHKLSAQHEVSIFERSERAGFDAGSHTIRDGDTDHHIDVPLRVFSRAYYPHLTALYGSLDIAVTRQEYGTSFTRYANDFANDPAAASDASSAYLMYDGEATSAIAFIRRILPWLLSPSQWPHLLQCVRFFRLCESDTPSQIPLDETLEAFLGRITPSFPTVFVEGVLYPMLAGILTCSYDAVRQYPAHIVLHYLRRSRIRDVYRVELGTDHVVRRLTALTHRVACRTTVLACFPAGYSIQQQDLASLVTAEELAAISQDLLRPPTESHAALVYRASPPDSKVHIEWFHHIIVAAPPTLALRFLKGPRTPVYEALASFKGEQSRVVLHRDPSLMPLCPSAWAPINMIVSTKLSRPMVSVWMNIAQKNLKLQNPLYQTWNPLHEPSSEHFLAESVFERPIMTSQSAWAIETLWKEQGKGNLWFCGSYSLYAMPLLENAVFSALKVSQLLGAPYDPLLDPKEDLPDHRLYSFTFITAFIAGAAYIFTRK